MRFLIMISLTMTFFSSCKTSSSALQYLPLGDSYTICEGASSAESWPVLLTGHLSSKRAVTLVANPARTGYTTQNLIDRELPLLEKNKIDLVTICIGVNDWVQGVDSGTFHRNLSFILDTVAKKISRPENILLLTIPDFGVTPQGKYYSGGRDISKGLSEFNAIIKAEAAKRKLLLVDLFPLSKKMGEDATLVAADGLHPSAREYAEWEKLILPEMMKMLK